MDVSETKPFSKERAQLLKDNIDYHQKALVDEIVEMEKSINEKKQDFWKMEGAKEVLEMYEY